MCILNKKKKISIIVPFYKGNNFLERLIKSIEKVELIVHYIAEFEVIIVNDSPEVMMEIPSSQIAIKSITNNINLGVHKTRSIGLKYATGEWILFLDQDDEIQEDGFLKQIECLEYADVVVGNGKYILGNINKQIYLNRKSMKYLIREEMFLRIRNLIPSPGECLIRKSMIPSQWEQNSLNTNGADDWFLWILLFKKGARFVCNEKIVYIHNDTDGSNLSANLDKMFESSQEMVLLLMKNKILSKVEKEILLDAISFKYLQDTKKITLQSLIKFRKPLIDNIKYKLKLYWIEFYSFFLLDSQKC